MSHFAEVIDGIVTQVIVAEQDFIDKLPNPEQWVQTSYNTVGSQHPEGKPLRKNFAGVGSIYDANLDAFYEPQPYPSWVLNEESCLWEAPIAKSDDPKLCCWDEETLSWVAPEIPQETNNGN